jgi:hypothetical protein
MKSLPWRSTEDVVVSLGSSIATVGIVDPEYRDDRKRTHVEELVRVLEGSTTTLRLSHRDRVRLSELKQALRTGREREPFGTSERRDPPA